MHNLLGVTTLILSPLEKATLQALAEACNYSLACHVPKEAVTRKFPGHLRGEAKKGLKDLKRKGCCQTHPTGGNTTWELTSLGLNIANSYFKQ